MIPRPEFRRLFLTVMIVLSTGLFSPATARPRNEVIEPVTIAEISFTSSPITNLQGTVVGVTIPLKRAGRLLLLEGTIDHVIGNFILDTGSSSLVVNKTYFRSSMSYHDEEGGGVTGSTDGVARIHVKKLLICESAYTNISADVIPLGHLENRRGVKILGLFGLNLMKNHEIVIDVNNNELQIFNLDKAGNRIDVQSPVLKYDLIQKIEEFHHIMFVKAAIGGKILDFCLDTGAESNVLSIDANKKILSTVIITRRSGLSGAGENRGEVLYGTLTEFLMGNRQLVPMETIVCSLTAMAQKYGYPIDGMLGFDFFAKGRISINLVKKEMGICLMQEGRK